MRKQIFSYGGGKQTVAMIALVLQGRLPRPDRIIFADTGYENSSTWDYLDEIVQPALAQIGMRVEVAPHSLATVDLYSGNGDLLIPVYTATGKLPTFCSSEWKERVVQRYLRSVDVESCDVWIGYSTDESHRANRRERLQWYKRRYPLLELSLSRADCRLIIAEQGWCEPHSSSCKFCPNKTDAEWLEMREYSPDDFAYAVDIEKEMREWDDEIYLHDARVPLDEVAFDSNRKRGRDAGRYQCSLWCMV